MRERGGERRAARLSGERTQPLRGEKRGEGGEGRESKHLIGEGKVRCFVGA